LLDQWSAIVVAKRLRAPSLLGQRWAVDDLLDRGEEVERLQGRVGIGSG
jgi:hypothetical protein